MGEDRREDILARIRVVLQSVIDPNSVQRNSINVPETMRPAIILNDQDETIEPRLDASGRNRPSNSTVIVSLKPEIFILAQDSKDTIGTSLNQLRAQVISKIMNDAQLIGLCHEIIYDGFSTALAIGRSMEAQGRVYMTFNYVLRVSKL